MNKQRLFKPKVLQKTLVKVISRSERAFTRRCVDGMLKWAVSGRMYTPGDVDTYY